MRKNKRTKADVLWEIAVVCEHVTKQYHNTGEQRKWLKVVLNNAFFLEQVRHRILLMKSMYMYIYNKYQWDKIIPILKHQNIGWHS